ALQLPEGGAICGLGLRRLAHALQQLTQTAVAFGEVPAVVRNVRVFVSQSGKDVPCLLITFARQPRAPQVHIGYPPDAHKPGPSRPLAPHRPGPAPPASGRTAAPSRATSSVIARSWRSSALASR